MFETGKLTPLNLKPIHIASMLAEVLEAAYATDERGNVKDLLRLSIRCSNKVPPVVCADSSLQRILFNLVSNAMQFCSEKGEVSLAVHFSQPKPTSNAAPQPLSGRHPTPYPILPSSALRSITFLSSLILDLVSTIQPRLDTLFCSHTQLSYPIPPPSCPLISSR
jgi:signal transduction histidine kinase